MRFTIQVVAIFAAIFFGVINAAPVPAADANAEPHNYFRNRYGGGYATPHFVSMGTWKRDETAKAAEVQKRQGPYGAGYGYGGGYGGRYENGGYYDGSDRSHEGRERRPEDHIGFEGVGGDRVHKEEDHRREKHGKEHGKEHREKEHRVKEHRENEHREGEHSEKGAIVEPRPLRKEPQAYRQHEKPKKDPAYYRYGKALAKGYAPTTVALVEAAYGH